MKQRDPNSNRSKRRNNRGFESLEKHSRKHRRAAKRMMVACTITRSLREPGEKVAVPVPGKAKPASHTAGGSLRYHC